MALLAVALSCGCALEPQPVIEADLGPIEDILDDVVTTVWPGVVGTEGRYVRRINGFFDGAPTAYWFSGFAPRFTAPMFWFCRQGDAACPMSEGKLDPASMVGLPVFARIPGEAGYSPYWAIQVVRVPADYQPNALKSVFGIENAATEGKASVAPLEHDHGGAIGVAPVIVHCLMVLAGTTLEHNGGDMIAEPGVPSLPIPLSLGWHKQYRVRLYDFGESDGFFAPDPEGGGALRMPSAPIYVLFRDCDGGAQAPLCGLTQSGFPAVSERGVEQDFTGDGDKSDTNNLVASFPGIDPKDPQDRPYSPLWAVNVARVLPEHDAEVELVDSSGDQQVSSIRSVEALRQAVANGLVAEPEPMSEALAGDSIPGNDGEVFFNCPAQVPLP